MRDVIEVVLDDGSNRIAVWRNVFVQARRGPQTMQSCDLLSVSWRSLKRGFEGDLFAIFIVEPGAEAPGPEVRRRQIAIIKEVFAYGRLQPAVVIEGDGVIADLKRTAARGLADGRVKVFSDVWDAVRMLAALPGAPSMAEMLAVVDVARKPDG
jgi:hypothetical protein